MKHLQISQTLVCLQWLPSTTVTTMHMELTQMRADMGITSTKIITIIAASRIRTMYGNGDDTTCTTLPMRTSLSFLLRLRGLRTGEVTCLPLLFLGDDIGEVEDTADEVAKIGLQADVSKELLYL